MARRADAFTLIELLEVISIIAMLVGLMMPALAGAREITLRVTGMKHYPHHAASHSNAGDTRVSARMVGLRIASVWRWKRTGLRVD